LITIFARGLAIALVWVTMWALGYVSIGYIMSAIYGGLWLFPILLLLPVLVFAAAGFARRRSMRLFVGGQLLLTGLVLWVRMAVVGFSDHTAEKHGIVLYELGEPTAWGVAAEIAIATSSVGVLLLLFMVGSFAGRQIRALIRVAQ